MAQGPEMALKWGMHQRVIKPSRFNRLILEETKSGAASIAVVRETAEFFGWDKAFPEWSERWKDDYPGGRRRHTFGSPNPYWVQGGKRLRICRSKRKTGYPQGKTHCFRLIGAWSNRHLVQLAVVAGDKFEWMERPNGERIDRDEWLSLAQREKPPA